MCQPNWDTEESEHLQAGHRLPQRGRQKHTRLGDSATGQNCTETTKPPTKSIADNVPIGPLHKDK